MANGDLLNYLQEIRGKKEIGQSPLATEENGIYHDLTAKTTEDDGTTERAGAGIYGSMKAIHTETAQVFDNLDSIAIIGNNIPIIEVVGADLEKGIGTNTLADSAILNALTNANNAIQSASEAASSEANTASDKITTNADVVITTNDRISSTASEIVASAKAAESVVSAASALASENNASISESNANTSANNSATNEANSAQSASDANASAINTALDKLATAADVTSCADSEAVAIIKASEASASAGSATMSADFVDNLVLGAKTTDPLTDNNGGVLQQGSIYYNTSTVPKQLKIWNDSAWDVAVFNASGTVLSFNNRVGDVTLSVLDIETALGFTINEFTLAEKTRLGLIEDEATADQTADEIKIAYESNFNTNAYTDIDNAKVGNISVTQAVNLDTIESDVSSHNASASNPHNVTKAQVGLSDVDNTSDLAKDSATSTLTNKTIISPVISSPTGLAKADIGLENAENTADIDKPISTDAQSYIDTNFASKTSTTQQKFNAGIELKSSSNNIIDLVPIGDNFAYIQILREDGTRIGTIGSISSDGSTQSINVYNADGTILKGSLVINNLGEITFNGYKVWHSNNDGIDSGLDAGLLAGTLLDIAESPSTVVKRDALGNVRGYSYKLAIPRQTELPSGVMIEIGTDGYIRRQSVADFRSNMSYGNGTFWNSANQSLDNTLQALLFVNSIKDSGLTLLGNEVTILEAGMYNISLELSAIFVGQDLTIGCFIYVNGVYVTRSDDSGTIVDSNVLITSINIQLNANDIVSCKAISEDTGWLSVGSSDTEKPLSSTKLMITRI